MRAVVVRGKDAAAAAAAKAGAAASVSAPTTRAAFEARAASLLAVGTAPRPQPTGRELLVRVAATAVNRADTLQRDGKYPAPPGDSELLGLELAGSVVEVGADVNTVSSSSSSSSSSDDAKPFEVGTEVFGLVGGGGYAEYCLIPAGCALRRPESLSATEAAALPEAFLTAFQALVWIGGLDVPSATGAKRAKGPAAGARPGNEGKAVLVHAAASGVGLAAVQICAVLGVSVVATLGGESKAEAVRAEYARASKAAGMAESGATCTVVDRRTLAEPGDFVTGVKEAHPEGVDVVLDFVGAQYWASNIASCRAEATVVLLGFLSGAAAPAFSMADLLRKRITVTGSTLRARSVAYKEQLSADLGTFLQPHLESGAIRPNIHATFPISDVAKAHAVMEANENVGKLVLSVSEEDFGEATE